MAALAATHPTLLDMATRQDPNGGIADIAEFLKLTNEIVEDMVIVEGNLPTGHRSTIRTGLPAPTWRKLYGGVQPTKSSTAQITDNCGSLEAYAEVDKKLADLNGNTAAFRISEDSAHLQGMNQEMASTLFFGDETLAPEEFTGIAPRFNSLSAANAENIIVGGSASGQTDNMSIWLMVWGPQTVFGITPKGLPSGLQMEDKGQVTIESVDGAGGRMEAYRTHYSWDIGLCLKDWRYVVRIPNIDRSLLTGDHSTGAYLTDLMVQALERLPTGYEGMGRPAFYMGRTLRTTLRRQMIADVKQSTLTMDTLGGKQVMAFDGVPVRRCDALEADEARIA